MHGESVTAEKNDGKFA